MSAMEEKQLANERFQHLLSEDPLDVGTRLVYADWLEENGNPFDAGRQRFLAAVMSKNLPLLKAIMPRIDL